MRCMDMRRTNHFVQVLRNGLPPAPDLFPQLLFVRFIHRGIWSRHRLRFLQPPTFHELESWHSEIKDIVDGRKCEGNAMGLV